MEKIKVLFKTYKKPTVIVALVLTALSIPLVVSQVLKSQDIRQHADTAPQVTITFDPATKPLKVNDALDLKLPINTNTNDISAIDGYLIYDHTLFTLTSITPGTDYTQVVMPTTTASESANITQQEYVFLNKTAHPHIGSAVIPAIFHFTAKAVGTGTISFGSLPVNNIFKLAASTYATKVPSSTPGAKGTYTITAQNVSPTIALSPTPNCVGSSNLPNDCACTNDNQCKSTKCSPIDGQGNGVCQDYLTPMPSPSNPPTPIPGDTIINVSVEIPGVGTGEARLGLNNNPVRNHTVTVQITNSKNTLVKTISGTAIYDNINLFKRAFSLGTDFPSGSYTIKVKTENSLYKAFPGIIYITNGQSSSPTTLTATLVTGDLDSDNKLTIADYTLFIACYKSLPACTSSIATLADLNDNGTAVGDTDDENILQSGFANRNGD